MIRLLIPLIAFLLSACAPTALTKPGAAEDRATRLQAVLDQTVRENKEACKSEEYKPLYLKSACKTGAITAQQLADTSRISAAEMALLTKFRSEGQARIKKAAAAYRSYGGNQGNEQAMILERTQGLVDKNIQNLYDGTITWGDYSKRRKEIQQLYLDEFEKTVK